MTLSRNCLFCCVSFRLDVNHLFKYYLFLFFSLVSLLPFFVKNYNRKYIKIVQDINDCLAPFFVYNFFSIECLWVS